MGAIDFEINNSVPAMQELLNTPLTTFPPLERELWQRAPAPDASSSSSIAVDAAAADKLGAAGHARSKSRDLR